jgi:hypothetical protein
VGGGGSTQSTVNENPLPDWAASYVASYLVTANTLSLDNGGVFPDYNTATGEDTYADQTAAEIAGIAALGTATTAVHAIATKGETLLRATLDGSYINANPKLVAEFEARRDQLLDEFNRETLPNIHRSFRMLGRYGGGSHHITQYIAAERLSKVLADLALEIFGEDYMLERERRVTSLGWGVPYGTEDIRVAEFHRQAGLYTREFLQGGYQNAYDIWKAEQMSAQERLDILTNAIKATVGASPTNMSRPYYLPKPVAQIAGIALAGMGMFAAVYGKAGNDPGLSVRISEAITQKNQQQYQNSQFGGPTGPGGQGGDRTGVGMFPGDTG